MHDVLPMDVLDCLADLVEPAEDLFFGDFVGLLAV